MSSDMPSTSGLFSALSFNAPTRSIAWPAAPIIGPPCPADAEGGRDTRAETGVALAGREAATADCGREYVAAAADASHETESPSSSSYEQKGRTG